MATNANPKFFSVNEANLALQDLRATLPALRRTLREIEAMEGRLEVLDLICDRAVVASNADLSEFLSAKVRYHEKITEFEGMLYHLENEGYLLRDLEKGVVHFPSRRGAKVVLLCWNEGEERIAHWHTIEGARSPGEGRRLTIEDWDAL
jgi:hypothetical protein